MKDSHDELMRHFKSFNRIILASVEKDQPRLRPVTLIHHEGRFLMTTGSGDDKVAQIKQNPKIEFLLLIPEEENMGYIRATCIAKIDHDSIIRKVLFGKVPFMSQLWESPKDSNLTVMELVPIEYDYMKPGDFHSTKILA